MSNYMNEAAATPVRTRALDESLRDSHRAVTSLEAVLDSILGDLNGYGTDTAGGGYGGPSSGIVDDASILADHLSRMIDRAEQIRSRIRSSEVVEMAVKQNTQGGLAGRSLGY